MAEAQSAPGGAERFRAALAGAGLTNPVVELPESTHTAGDAARGPNRVDDAAVGALIGEPIGHAIAPVTDPFSQPNVCDSYTFGCENEGYQAIACPPFTRKMFPVA